MAQGARSKFGVPMFEPKVIREQVYCVEESTCDIVVILAPSAVIRHPGNCAPIPPFVSSLRTVQFQSACERTPGALVYVVDAAQGR